MFYRSLVPSKKTASLPNSETINSLSIPMMKKNYKFYLSFLKRHKMDRSYYFKMYLEQFQFCAANLYFIVDKFNFCIKICFFVENPDLYGIILFLLKI